MKKVHKKNIYEKLKESTVILNRDIWFSKNIEREPDIPKGTKLRVVNRMINGAELMVKYDGKTFRLPKEWIDEK